VVPFGRQYGEVTCVVDQDIGYPDIHIEKSTSSGVGIWRNGNSFGTSDAQGKKVPKVDEFERRSPRWVELTLVSRLNCALNAHFGFWQAGTAVFCIKLGIAAIAYFQLSGLTIR
jgi:hypothetical protein